MVCPFLEFVGFRRSKQKRTSNASGWKHGSAVDTSNRMVFGIVFHEECLTLVPFIEGRTETVKYGYLEKKIALLESLLRALFMSLFLRL